MGESIVERVARAIYEAGEDRTGWPWDRSVLGGREYWLSKARAAIEAMREATPTMENAAYSESGTGDDGTGERGSFEAEWTAAIDAALAPGGVGGGK